MKLVSGLWAALAEPVNQWNLFLAVSVVVACTFFHMMPPAAITPARA